MSLIYKVFAVCDSCNDEIEIASANHPIGEEQFIDTGSYEENYETDDSVYDHICTTCRRFFEKEAMTSKHRKEQKDEQEV